MRAATRLAKTWRSVRVLTIVICFVATQISGCAPTQKSRRDTPTPAAQPPTSPNPMKAEQETKRVEPKAEGAGLAPKAVDALIEDVTEQPRTHTDDELVQEEENRAQEREAAIDAEEITGGSDASRGQLDRPPVTAQPVDENGYPIIEHETKAKPEPEVPARPARKEAPTVKKTPKQEPPKPAPVKPAPPKVEPAKPAPVKPTPKKEEPPKPAPTKEVEASNPATAPKKPEQKTEEKSGSAPTVGAPAQTASSTDPKRVLITPEMVDEQAPKAAPKKEEKPVKKPDPVEPAPVKSAPVKPAPKKDEKPAPVKPEAQAEPAKPEPKPEVLGKAELVKPQPKAAEPKQEESKQEEPKQEAPKQDVQPAEPQKPSHEQQEPAKPAAKTQPEKEVDASEVQKNEEKGQGVEEPARVPQPVQQSEPIPKGTYKVINTETCEKLSLATRDYDHEMKSLQKYAGELPETLPVEYYRNIESYAKKRGLDMSASQLKKNHFTCMLLPTAIRFNAYVFRQRLEVLRLDVRDKKGALRPEDKRWLETMKLRYLLPSTASNKELLERVDVVPVPLLLAQAAEESGWGTSRATKDANNIFGLHASSGQSGIAVQGSSKVRLRKFPSIPHAVAEYIEYMNTSEVGFAKSFRQARAKQRVQGRRLDSGALADALNGYSERGRAYCEQIKGIIFAWNDLSSYDLREEEVTALKPGFPGEAAEQQTAAK